MKFSANGVYSQAIQRNRLAEGNQVSVSIVFKSDSVGNFQAAVLSGIATGMTEGPSLIFFGILNI